MNDKTITILGAGYVGLTTATLFANSGFKVYLVEPNEKRLKTIKSGKSFFFEAGLDPLIKKAVQEKALLPTDSYEESVPNSSFIFSCVGTPDNPDGSSNLTYVFSAAKETVKYIQPGSTYVQKSTVPVGTGQKVSKVFDDSINYVSNPEFLREGTALSDSLYFDRVVVGSNDKDAANKVIDLYKTVEKNRNTITKTAAVKESTKDGKYITTNLNSAELIKVTSNAFLALKISFANSIAKLADHTGADINEVMDAVGADKRIGRAFLNAGRGYGGGCFPKDVSGLISSANEHGVDLQIMTAAADVNESMPGYIANKAQEELGGLRGKKLAVLGLAFKAGTSDSRRSPGVKLANILSHSGAKVTAYDPKANGEAKEDLRKDIKICDSAGEALAHADAVFIATDWPEFLELAFSKIIGKMNGNLFVDCMNCFDISKVQKSGFKYLGIGRK
jgi:UDPglucose 6-dehydrogenase